MIVWSVWIVLLVKYTESFSKDDFQTVADFHTRICKFPNTCHQSNQTTYENDTVPDDSQKKDLESCCQLCSCNFDTCVLRGTCCLKDIADLDIKKYNDSRPKQTCEPLNYHRVSKQTYQGAWMFSTCPHNTNVSDTILLKCERPFDSDLADTHIPVFDGHFIYKNIYCAMCHRVQDFGLFGIYIRCSLGEYVPLSRDSVIFDFQAPDCEIVYSVPFTVNDHLWSKMSMKDHACYANENIVKTCNTTGDWMTYDPLIDAACNSYTSVFHSGNGILYKNVFCYLCNSNKSYLDQIVCSIVNTYSEEGIVPVLTRLLDFNPIESQQANSADKTCSQRQVLDKSTNLCLDITCPTTMILEDDKCTQRKDQIQSGKYKIFIALTLTEIFINDSHFHTDEFKHALFSANKTVLEKVGEAILSRLSIFWDDLFVFINTYAFYSYVLEEIINPFKNPLFVVYREFYIRPNLYNFSIIKYVLNLDSNEFNVSLNGHIISFSSKLDIFRMVPSGGHVLQTMNQHLKYQFVQGTGPNKLLKKYIDAINGTVVLPKYTCVLVNIPNTYEIKRFADSVEVRSWGINISNRYYYLNSQQGDTDLQVCLEIFYEINSQNQIQINTNDLGKVLTVGILSFICSSLSVLFATAAIIVYSLFRELRTQPGVNNMCLCSALVFAQLMDFSAGGIQDHSPSCKVLGVFVHLAWLHMVGWLNVCSLHMYRSFNSMYAPTASFSIRLTSYYVLYSVILSFSPVLVNILLHVSTDFGYSNDTCYISRSYMIGYTFAAPVALLIFINIGLFLKVVCILSNRPTVQSSCTASQNTLKIYTKLSTITGITWVFGFIFQFTKLDIFQYVFIILSSSQGVLLFIAFIANKRVLGLCTQRFRRDMLTSSSSARMNRTQEIEFCIESKNRRVRTVSC